MRVLSGDTINLPDGAMTADYPASGLLPTDAICIIPQKLTDPTTVFHAVYKSATEITIVSSVKTTAGDTLIWYPLRDDGFRWEK